MKKNKFVSMLVAGALIFSAAAPTATTFAAGQSYTVYGKIFGFEQTEDSLVDAVVSLTPSGSETPEYVAEGINDYKFENVKPGKYTLSINGRDGYVQNDYSVKIKKDTRLDVELFKTGDINKDGIVDENDVEEIDTKAKRKKMEDEYVSEIADVNYDGKVNEKDATILGDFVNGETEALPEEPIVIDKNCQAAIDEKLFYDDMREKEENSVLVMLSDMTQLEQFLVNDNIKDYEVIIEENDKNIKPVIKFYFKDDIMPEEQASIFAQNNYVSMIEPNYSTKISLEATNNSGKTVDFSNLTASNFTDFWVNTNLDAAWQLTNQYPLSEIRVAIIDTGCNTGSPPFKNNPKILKNICGACTESSSIITAPWGNDDVGHGTMTAHIVNMTSEVTDAIKIFSVAITLGKQSTNTSNIANGNYLVYTDEQARAFWYAYNNGANVISNSWGGSTISPILEETINQIAAANVFIVAATGNNGETQMYHNPQLLKYPSSYASVYSVGLSTATDKNMTRQDYSCFGKVDILAPTSYAYKNNSGLGNYGGTSSAAPFVAGVVALMKSINPDLTNNQIREILNSTATDLVYDILRRPHADYVSYNRCDMNNINSTINRFSEAAAVGYDQYTGYGLINAGAAMSKAIEYHYGTASQIDIGKAISKITIPKNLAYTGNYQDITKTVKLWAGSKQLVYGQDYIFSCTSVRDAGTHSIVAAGIGNYTGTYTISINVSASSINKAAVTFDKTSYDYTGNQITPAPTVKLNGTTLKMNQDYTISYGTNIFRDGYVIIKGINNYAGTVEKHFTIKSNDLFAFPSFCDVAIANAEQTYNGKAKTPKVTVTFKNNANGKMAQRMTGRNTPKEGVDYTVVYKNNINAGNSAVIYINGKGIFGSHILRYFTIAKAVNPITITTANKTVSYSAKAQTISGAVTIKNAKGTVTYTKISGSSYLTINKSTGKVTVASKTPKGTYKISVKIKAAGNNNYNSKEETKTINITVK